MSSRRLHQAIIELQEGIKCVKQRLNQFTQRLAQSSLAKPRKKPPRAVLQEQRELPNYELDILILDLEIKESIRALEEWDAYEIELLVRQKTFFKKKR